MRKNIAAGNWKMNLTLEEGQTLVSGILEKVGTLAKDTQLIFSPSYPYLSAIKSIVGDSSNVFVASQNIHQEVKGAYTGEVSGPMLNSIGITHCIIGHSERRQYFGEGNALLAKKIDQALAHGLVPIYCIGETLDQREAGQTLEVNKAQLSEGAFHLEADSFSTLIIAYEPVWAIGTGKTASPEQAQEVHEFIREQIADKYGEEVAEGTSILYGGSVKPANASELFAQKDIDGGLVGGASLKVDDFAAIVQSF